MGGRSEWCSALDDARTEVEETLLLLEEAHSKIQLLQSFSESTSPKV